METTLRKEKPEKKELIVLHESFWQSLACDLGSALATIIIIGVGVYLDSRAMQWVGFIVLAVGMLNRVSGIKQRHSKSPQEAADYIYEKFNVKAKD